MDRWIVLGVWSVGLAAGVATWWALLAWFGPEALLVPLAVAAVAALGVREPPPGSRAAPPAPAGLD